MTVLNFFVPNRNTIASITNANPGVVTTTTDHTYHNGLLVRLVIPLGLGMPEVNGNIYEITVLSNNSFSINVDTTNFEPFKSGSSAITNISNAANAVVTVSSPSNFNQGMQIFLSGI